MQLPADLQRYHFVRTYPLVGTVNTLLPAPGANRRLRVWAAVLTCDFTTAAGVGFVFLLRDAVAGAQFGSLSVVGKGTHNAELVIPGGYALQPDSALQAVVAATAGAPAYENVYYTVEDI